MFLHADSEDSDQTGLRWAHRSFCWFCHEADQIYPMILVCCRYISAGSELTWDYNYEVGSVPGKVLYCYCGSAECRGRLL